MVMPIDLILVRHGQSEANVVQKENKADIENYEFPVNFVGRHDSRMRLTAEGVEQAEAAGKWLKDNGLTSYDHYYVSPHLRTLETAGHLRIGGEWHKDDRWRERDWGEYGASTIKMRETQYASCTASRKLSEWYWCPTGGESLATGVRNRFEDILDSLHRQAPDGRVIAVTHGEMIRTAQFVLERMTPLEWEKMDDDPAYKMNNCQILHYTRKDPVTGEIARRMTWRRGISPWDPSKSWDNGEWVRLEDVVFTDESLLAEAEALKRVLL